MKYTVVRIIDDNPTAYGPYKTKSEAQVAMANLADAYIKGEKLPRTWLDASTDGKEIYIQPPEETIDYPSYCAVYIVLLMRKGV